MIVTFGVTSPTPTPEVVISGTPYPIISSTPMDLDNDGYWPGTATPTSLPAQAASFTASSPSASPNPQDGVIAAMGGPWALWAVVALLLILASVGTWAIFRRRPGDPEPPSEDVQWDHQW